MVSRRTTPGSPAETWPAGDGGRTGGGRRACTQDDVAGGEVVLEKLLVTELVVFLVGNFLEEDVLHVFVEEDEVEFVLPYVKVSVAVPAVQMTCRFHF